MSESSLSLHYRNYLQLDKILDAQKLLSLEKGKLAHEEMLFIIIHQTYELWFKQIIHEFESIKPLFEKNKIDEEKIGMVVNRMDRVVEILKVLVQQIQILETMSSLDFLDFRDHLSPASGFQSFQFRKLEVLLGLKIKQRHAFGSCPYHSQFEGKKKKEILNLESSDSFFNLVEKWLERTPFLNFEDFDFIQQYEHAVNAMIDKEAASIKNSELLSKDDKKIRIRMIEENRKYFERIFDSNKHKEALESENVHFSYKATMSALLIHLYRDEPILHLPYRFLRSLLEIDHLISTWRFRHAQMVEKMLGQKIGTGGSSGSTYLQKTIEQNKIFTDLANISTLMIPRSHLPDLPKKIKEKLGFNFSPNT